MNWLQNGIIVVVCFLMARVIIDAGIHRYLVQLVLKKSRGNISWLVTGILLASYFFSFLERFQYLCWQPAGFEGVIFFCIFPVNFPLVFCLLCCPGRPDPHP